MNVSCDITYTTSAEFAKSFGISPKLPRNRKCSRRPINEYMELIQQTQLRSSLRKSTFVTIHL